jgi:hypothetical protein
MLASAVDASECKMVGDNDDSNDMTKLLQIDEAGDERRRR